MSLKLLKEEVLSGKYGTKNRVQLLLRIEGLLVVEKKQMDEVEYLWHILYKYWRKELNPKEALRNVELSKKVFNQ